MANGKSVRKRPKNLMVTCTEEEHSDISNIAEACGLRTSDYVRMVAMYSTFSVKVDWKKLEAFSKKKTTRNVIMYLNVNNNIIKKIDELNSEGISTTRAETLRFLLLRSELLFKFNFNQAQKLIKPLTDSMMDKDDTHIVRISFSESEINLLEKKTKKYGLDEKDYVNLVVNYTAYMFHKNQ